MAAPVQVFDRVVEPLAGDALNASTYKQVAFGQMDSAVTADPIYQGRAVHVHTVTIGTNYEDPTMYRPLKGFRPGAVGKQVPYLLLRGTNDLDTQGVSDASVNGYLTTTGTNKLISAICMYDSFEFATREYDSGQTYAANDYLRSIRSDSSSATAGTFTNQTITLNTNSIHAQVTSGTTVNKYNKAVLHAMAMYLPGSEATS